MQKWTDSDDSRLIAMAEDPNLTIRQSAEALGRTYASIASRARDLGLKWNLTGNPGPTKRVLTAEEDIELRKMAADPAMPKHQARRILRLSDTVMTRHIEQHGIYWATKFDRHDPEMVRKLAADDSVNKTEAAQKLGVTSRVLDALLERFDAKWVAKRIDYAAIEAKKAAKRPPTPQAQINVGANERMIIKRPAPDVETPDFTMTSHLGGWQWRCDALDVGGWKAADSEAQARDMIVDDLKRIVDRIDFHARRPPKDWRPAFIGVGA